MPFSNYIYEYYDGISSGNITVGKWVRLLYEYIVKGLQEGLFTFNAKKANKAIRFMGVSVSPDFFKEEIAVAEMSMSKRAEFLTKYCNKIPCPRKGQLRQLFRIHHKRRYCRNP